MAAPCMDDDERAFARSLGSPPRPVPSDNLIWFLCVHCDDVYTSRAHVADSYRRMMSSLSRRRFDVYNRASVSPCVSPGGRTLAQLAFHRFYADIGIDEILLGPRRGEIDARLRAWRASKKRKAAEQGQTMVREKHKPEPTTHTSDTGEEQDGLHAQSGHARKARRAAPAERDAPRLAGAQARGGARGAGAVGTNRARGEAALQACAVDAP